MEPQGTDDSGLTDFAEQGGSAAATGGTAQEAQAAIALLGSLSTPSPAITSGAAYSGGSVTAPTTFGQIAATTGAGASTTATQSGGISTTDILLGLSVAIGLLFFFRK